MKYFLSLCAQGYMSHKHHLDPDISDAQGISKLYVRILIITMTLLLYRCYTLITIKKSQVLNY